MSEPMSSVEIEDVLSSIRRLVSDDLRPQARPQPPQAQDPRPMPEAAPAAAAEKLLLTPALRIVQDDSPPPADEVPSFHSVRVAEEEARFIAVEDDGAELSATVTDLSTYYEDDTAPAPTPPMPEAFFAEAPAPETSPDHAADPSPEPARAEAAEPEPTAAADGQGGMDWADAAEAAVRAELEDVTIDTAYAHFLDDAPESAAPLDEEALRDLVRDIIREELQGTLGERITRNVRKLVRAEVARAMAVRDFE